MNAKKVAIILVIVFVGFWMFTDPSGLATNAKETGGWLWGVTTDLFSAVIDFIQQL